jgi:hypothetical protein
MPKMQARIILKQLRLLEELVTEAGERLITWRDESTRSNGKGRRH